MLRADTTGDPTHAADRASPGVIAETGAAPRVIRGATVRAAGSGVNLLLASTTAILLLRYLGVEDFGRYITVMALIGIVSGVTDAGLTAVGARELALHSPGEQRRRLLANLVAIRLTITPLGVIGATVFALIAGYDETMVYGTILAGIGIVLVNAQATIMGSLLVELRIGALTGLEVLRQLLSVVGIAALVAAGASLLPFFSVQVGVGATLLLLTPFIFGRRFVSVSDVEVTTARRLLRDTLPMAVGLAMGMIYFRALIIMMSLIATAVETGLFATSFRIFEVLVGIPTLVLTVALPLLAQAGRDNAERLRHGLSRMTQLALALAVGLVLLIAVVAEPMIELIGGDEYADAAPVLRIQALALIGVFLNQTWQLGLISIGRYGSIAAANAGAFALVVGLGLALIPPYGAEGAAWAAVVGEAFLAALLFASIRRADRRIAPSLRCAPRIAIAAVIGGLGALIPGLPAAPAALLACVLYTGAALATGAIPRDVVEALVFRRPAARRPRSDGAT
jgi:O-antigen/teichoic acid export membrane protein